MKLNKKKVIYLLDNQNEVMSQKMISELKIKEEYINNQSKTKYQNSEPCIIIRTKICNTVYLDFNDFAEIFNIVNTRLLRSKKTIISTNLTPKEISDTYTDRVFSRIFDKFNPLKFYGNDLRWE